MEQMVVAYTYIYMVRNYIKLKDMVVGFANGNLV